RLADPDLRGGDPTGAAGLGLADVRLPHLARPERTGPPALPRGAGRALLQRLGHRGEAGGGPGMRGALRTLRWLAARGFLTPGHLRTALRYLWVRLRHPEVEFEGYAFVGPGVRFEVRRGYGKLIIGRWAHLGERVKLRAHEGVLR